MNERDLILEAAYNYGIYAKANWPRNSYGQNIIDAVNADRAVNDLSQGRDPDGRFTIPTPEKWSAPQLDLEAKGSYTAPRTWLAYETPDAEDRRLEYAIEGARANLDIILDLADEDDIPAILYDLFPEHEPEERHYDITITVGPCAPQLAERLGSDIYDLVGDRLGGVMSIGPTPTFNDDRAEQDFIS